MNRQLVTLKLLMVFTLATSAQNQIEVKTLVADFYGNGAITIDQEGNVLVNEYGKPNADISGNGQNIYKVDPQGKVSILSNKVSGPIGGEIAKDGSYYFNNSSSMTNSDLMCLKNGELQKIATVPGFSADVLIDKTEDFLLITNYTLPHLHKVTLDGKVTSYITDERLKGCTGIAYGQGNEIFVSNFTTGKIYKIVDPDTLLEFATIPTVYPGYVVGYIIYFDGTIYATGYGASKIYRINEEGVVSELAGSGERIHKDGKAKEAGFLVPNGIGIDSIRNRLYISQNGNGKAAGLRYIDLN